jgi:transposase-like protein
MDLRKDVLRIAKKVYNASLKEIISERNFSINCPFCISKNIVVNGYSKNKKRFLCKDCKKSFFLNLSLSHKIL